MDEKLEETLKILRETNERLESKILELTNKLSAAEKAVELSQIKYDSYVKQTLLKEAFLASGGKTEATDMMIKLLERDIKVDGDKLIGLDDKEIAKVFEDMRSNPLTAASFNPSNSNQGSGSGADAKSQVDRVSAATEIMKISDPVVRLSKARQLGLANVK